MRAEAARLLGFFAVTVSLVVAVGALGPRLLSLTGGPEGELITQLKRVEHLGLDEAVAPLGQLKGTRVLYQRLSVRLDEAQAHAVVTCTLDFTGAVQDGPQVSSLGLEKVAFVQKGGRWEPVEGFVPRLARVLRALEHRRAALERGELELAPDAGPGPDGARLLAMKRRRYRVRAWFIRSEREEVTVAEDYTLEGELPERPVSEQGTRRLTLMERDGREFFFPAGLM